MLSIVDLAEKIGDYQRPYLTLFKVEFTPDDNKLSDLYAANKELAEVLAQTAKVTARIPGLTFEAMEAASKAAAVRTPSTVITSYDGFNTITTTTVVTGLTVTQSRIFQEERNAKARLKEAQLELNSLDQRRLALNSKLANSDSLTKHYLDFKYMCDSVDMYSIKTVFPSRKTVMQSFWWEGEQYFFTGKNDSDKQGEFTFILDQDMSLLPLLYLMKDLTGTGSGQFRAKRGNIYEGDYIQEFDFGLYQLSTDRVFTTNYCRLKGARVYEVSGVITDKSLDGTSIPLVSVKCGWDHTEWDDSRIGIPILSVEDLKVEE